MKKSNCISRAIPGFLFFMSLMSFILVKANDSISVPALPVELKYAGMIKNDPLFCVQIRSFDTGERFTLNISDEDGNRLFQGTMHGTMEKYFRLNVEELGDQLLSFEIGSNKSKRKLLYQANACFFRETFVCLTR
jgi:hypothetical protein